MATTKKNDVVEETMSLADVQKQIADMLAAAKLEADRIIEEARKASGSKAMSAESAAERKAAYERGEELVEVYLFKDGGKYKDDVFVSCNGERIAIKRGERVKIKRKFAEILDHSNALRAETEDRQRQMSDPENWPVTKFN